MSLFQWVGLPWNLLLSLGAMVASCIFVFDADWMWKLTRGQALPVPPQLFGGLLATRSMRSKAGYLALFGFVLAPLFMMRFMNLPPSASDALLAWLVGLALMILSALLWAEARGWKRWGSGLALMLCGMALFPYISAGWPGVQRYLFIEGMVWLIVAILCLGFLGHSLILGRAPQSQAVRITRMITALCAAVATMGGVFWPWMGGS